MGGKIKKGSAINRGYIGYHITWDGIKVFLRSKAEFIYARVLDYEKMPYKTECVRYTINERTYKPDFFIFDAKYEKILKIVETKGLDAKLVALEYLNKYKPYFNSINIEYDVIWKYQALITKYNLHGDIENWISKSLSEYDFIADSRGENNPMYGKKQTMSTKKLIRDKCIERNLDPEYRNKSSNSLKDYYNSATGLLRRKQISEQKKLLYATRNPIIKKQCICCNVEFEQKLKGNGFCNSKCLRTWKYNNIQGYGEHVHAPGESYKKQIMTYSKRIISYYNIDLDTYLQDLDVYVAAAKIDKLIPRNKGITKNALKKYNLENITQWQN